MNERSGDLHAPVRPHAGGFANFSRKQKELEASKKIVLKIYVPGLNAMNEIPQLASAMLTIVFAAVMLVAGQLFIEYRSMKSPLMPAPLTTTTPTFARM
jgi:hypothetical protein